MKDESLALCFQTNLTAKLSVDYLLTHSSSGRNSMVECQLPKLKVASSSLVARSK